MTIATGATFKTIGHFRPAPAFLARAATVGDQMLAAVANFWLTIAIGRAFAAEGLAAYGLGLAAALLIQSVQRHTLVIPLMLQRQSRSRRRAGGLIAQHWIVITAALLSGAIGVLFADGFGIPHYGQLIIAAWAACLVTYAELEFARAMLIKLGYPLSLMAASLSYAALSFVLGLAALLRWIDFSALLLFLALGMVVHALMVTIRIGRFNLRSGRRLLMANMGRYGTWSLVAAGASAGYSHIPLFLLGAIQPPVHAALFVATRSLLQPLQILLRGLDVADKAAFAERVSMQGSDALKAALRIAGIYAATGCLFGAMIYPFADVVLQLVYGPKFAGAGAVIMAWLPVFVLISCLMPLESLVYARGSFRSHYSVRAAGSAVAVGLAAPLIFRFAEMGAIVACAAGAFVAVGGATLCLYRETAR